MSHRLGVVEDDCAVSPPPTKRRRLSKDMVGAASTKEKNANHLAIYSWNVNGVGPLLQKQISFDQSASHFPLRAFLKRHSWPQLLCLQEVKIKHDDHATQRKLEFAANDGNLPGEPTYFADFSLPRDKHNAIGFGGKVHGVATLIRDDLSKDVAVTRKVDWDLEGRVLVTETVDQIAVINGYWVNGTDVPYKDPKTGAVVGTRHDHKLRFHQHMLQESLSLQRRGFGVVLIGDMNVARNKLDGHPNLRTSPAQHVKNRHDFNQKFFVSEDGFRGVDIFRHFHGQTPKFTYHPRGVNWGSSCDRVDNIIVSQSLVPAGPDAKLEHDVFHPQVIATDILDNATDRGHSDHVPLFVVLQRTFSALDSKPKDSEHDYMVGKPTPKMT